MKIRKVLEIQKVAGRKAIFRANIKSIFSRCILLG